MLFIPWQPQQQPASRLRWILSDLCGYWIENVNSTTQQHADKFNSCQFGSSFMEEKLFGTMFESGFYLAVSAGWALGAASASARQWRVKAGLVFCCSSSPHFRRHYLSTELTFVFQLYIYCIMKYLHFQLLNQPYNRLYYFGYNSDN